MNPYCAWTISALASNLSVQHVSAEVLPRMRHQLWPCVAAAAPGAAWSTSWVLNVLMPKRSNIFFTFLSTMTWAAWYNTWLPVELTPKGVVFSVLLQLAWMMSSGAYSKERLQWP